MTFGQNERKKWLNVIAKIIFDEKSGINSWKIILKVNEKPFSLLNLFIISLINFQF
jgi:hypothetical protein